MNQLTQPTAQPKLPAGAIRLRRCWTAMATRFDVELVGSDPEHLETVAAAIEDEVRRLDALLSRHNPTSEISRLNRRAAAEPLRVDADVWQLLADAEHYRRATKGFFEVTAAAPPAGAVAAHVPRLQLDAARQTVRFSSPHVAMDLGGIGKGFALDRSKDLLARFGVTTALLSAGTSSILAVGWPAVGEAWTVDVRHPVVDDADPIGRLDLVDRSMSCSATVRPGQAVSDIVDPHTGLPLAGGEAVLVLAASGVQAEALSTALLAMGRRRATQYLAGIHSTKVDVARVDVAWIDSSRQTPNLEWLVRSND